MNITLVVSIVLGIALLVSLGYLLHYWDQATFYKGLAQTYRHNIEFWQGRTEELGEEASDLRERLRNITYSSAQLQDKTPEN